MSIQSWEKWFSICAVTSLSIIPPENHIWPLMSFRPEIHFILLPITLICSICKVMFLFRLHILSMPILGREDTINDKIWNGMQQNEIRKRRMINDSAICCNITFHSWILSIHDFNLEKLKRSYSSDFRLLIFDFISKHNYSLNDKWY